MLELEDHEAGLLRNLLDEMGTLLEVRIEADPVTHRLFPRAYEDPDQESAYRELVGDELIDDKQRAVRAARSALGDDGGVSLELEADDVATWLRLLTDLRLAIGTRLEVDEARMSSKVDAGDPDAPALSVLHWLGWLQESLIERAIPAGGGTDP